MQEPRTATGRRCEIFVYYRVDASAAAGIGAAVRHAQASLTAGQPGLVARLLRRDDDPGSSTQTWMETYALDGLRDSPGVGPDLQQRIEAAIGAAAPALVGARHLEVFFADAA